jgi:hypothetical protein
MIRILGHNLTVYQYCSRHITMLCPRGGQLRRKKLTWMLIHWFFCIQITITYAGFVLPQMNDSTLYFLWKFLWNSSHWLIDHLDQAKVASGRPDEPKADGVETTSGKNAYMSLRENVSFGDGSILGTQAGMLTRVVWPPIVASKYLEPRRSCMCSSPFSPITTAMMVPSACNIIVS